MLNGATDTQESQTHSTPFLRAQRLARDINRQLMRSVRRPEHAKYQRHGRCALLEAAAALEANSPSIDSTLGALPFFIVDFSFSDETFWSRIAHRQPVLPTRDGGDSPFEWVGRTSLAKNVLLAAWVVCNHAPAFAPLTCGIRRNTAELLASVELESLDQLAQQHAGRLRPRWDCEDRFWRLLAMAAARSDYAVTQTVIAFGLRQLAKERWETRREVASGMQSGVDVTATGSSAVSTANSHTATSSYRPRGTTAKESCPCAPSGTGVNP